MKSICFTEELQSEVAARRKTETRRLTDPQPDDFLRDARGDFILPDGSRADLLARGHIIRPRYKVGEVIYIKEPYADDLDPDRVFYKYDPADIQDLQERGYGDHVDKPGFWWNKQAMPARQARYFLRITARHGERLQEISDEDCLKEGVISAHPGYYIIGIKADWEREAHIECPDGRCYKLFPHPKEAFAALIDATYGSGTWKRNPFVWVYTFEFVTELTALECRHYGLK